MKRSFAILSALVCWGATAPASAQIDLARARDVLGAKDVPRVFRERVSVLSREQVPGGVAVGNGWFALDAAPATLAGLAADAPEAALWWAPPRRLLLDRADGWIRASSFRSTTGLSGAGVVVGIIDSGVDPTHPDLQTADGKTRVRWWLDFSRPPASRHPELEEQYGCLGEVPCAVLSGDDIDELLSNDVEVDEPRDTFGHGTHVASLAAGNGLSSDPPRYIGVAPEAALVVARVARNGGGGIFDADVLKAASFVFERAEAMSMAAVANMSLGSDFGAHDGGSALELGLASLVGDQFPGRALVVAAGNSAGLYGVDLGLPQPLGIHTEVHVPRSSEVIVPIYTPPTSDRETSGTLYIWVGSTDGDQLSIGVDDEQGAWIAPVAPGRAGVVRKNDVEVTLVNQTELEGLTRGGGAVVVIDGRWPLTRTFSLRLTGFGTAELWVQSEGDLSPEMSLGGLLPRALKQGTINVPASSPALIAVGATLNRTDWQDYQGNPVSFRAHGALDDAPPDTTAFFSSAGPNALGVLKPDLVAPGVYVVGAMSRFADPRTVAGGTFAALGRCELGTADECFVVDDWHAVTSGTSMSAPIVAGAVALMLERDPTLTQPQVRALLQAGARPLEGVTFAEQQVGAGALDLEGSLLAQIADDSPAERLPSGRSWMALGDAYVRPDPNEWLRGIAELRDELGQPADGFDQARLGLRATPGNVVLPLTRLASGLYEFAVSAPAGSGGEELVLELSFDGAVVVTRSLPIAVDAAVATSGVAARGGCSLASERSGVQGVAWLLLLGLLTASLRTRSRRAARRVRRPDRAGRRASLRPGTFRRSR